MSARAGSRVPAGLADAEVVGIDGARVRLGDAWGERTAVLVFVRHFG